jgi:hypothetical protein
MVAEGRRGAFVKSGEADAIEAYQTFVGANPQVALAVLRQRQPAACGSSSRQASSV